MEAMDNQFIKAGLGNITLINRGINGGFVQDLRDGIPSSNITGFNQSLIDDQPTIVTIFIGTNDVWFPDNPKHSNPDQFVVRVLLSAPSFVWIL